MDTERAYRFCESVARRRAANFSYGIRLLPPPKRRALCAVYAFARRIDDIGDGGLPAEEKARRLANARTDLDGIGTATHDPVLVALADASFRFPVPVAVFHELIDGVETDVWGTSFERFEDLVVYCRRVAGSIGRVSLGVFGASHPDVAAPRADALGVAMQLTNILRDIREDRAAGRVYLPREDLERFGCADLDPARTPSLVRFEAARARGWFDRGLGLLPMLDRRSAACVSAMAGIYRRILARIERQPHSVLDGRVSLPVWEKAWVATRSLAAAGGVSAT